MGTMKKNRNSQDREVLAESYKVITSRLCKIPLSEKQLLELKDHFKDEIDSPRRLELISNLEELIQVLERRDVVGVSNINALYLICGKLGAIAGIGLLLNNHARVLAKQPQILKQCIFNIDLISDIDIVLPEPVVHLIATNINLNWKNFARNLLIITENEIDVIDDSFLNKEEKVKEVLRVYTREARIKRLGNPYSLLFSALENIKRRDVKENVEAILNTSLRH